MAEALLSVQELSIRFGGIVALDRVSFEVPAGAIVGLIGPNGAGKTTLFNCMTRLYSPDAGDIQFEGRTLLDARPHEMVVRGLARTFQNVALFPNMSVRDNVMVGLHTEYGRSRGHWLVTALGWPPALAGERSAVRRADEALGYVGLAPLADRPAAGLPFATLKAIELSRALVSRPKLLLLDEPAGGLNHEEVADLSNLIRRIHDDFQVTILLVEHHMNLVMSVSDQVVVLDFGRRIAAGTPAQVRSDPAVIEAYLGVAGDGAA